jgi:hypothetical protein
VGDGAENTGPVTSTKARPPAKSTITPAPKPQVKRRGRKGQTAEPPANDGADTADEPSATDDQNGDEARDDVPTAYAAGRPAHNALSAGDVPGRRGRDRALLRDARQAG